MAKENPVIEALIQNYDGFLKSTVMMVKNLEAAQDIMQNLAANLFAKRKELNDIVNIPAFLVTCLRRAALNHIRDSSRSIPTEPNLIEQMHGELHSKIAVDFIEWEQVLRNYLVGYSEELIQAFVDHYINDLPIERLSFKIGLTPNALSQQFRRMRNKIASSSPKMALYMLVLTMRTLK